MKYIWLIFEMLNRTLDGLKDLGQFMVYITVVVLLLTFYPYVIAPLIALVVLVTACELFDENNT